MHPPVQVRVCDEGSAKLRKQGARLGEALHRNGAPPSKVTMLDGYIWRAVRAAGRVAVTAVDMPGRFVFIAGESDIVEYEDGVGYRQNYGVGLLPRSVGLAGVFQAPVRREMQPTTPTVDLDPGEPQAFPVGSYYAVGAPIPTGAVYRWGFSDPTPYPGGLVTPYVLSDIPPKLNADYETQQANKWVFALDCPVGGGGARHLAVSEAYLQGLSGYGLLGRTDAPNYTPRAAGGIALAAHRVGERLVLAMNVAKAFPNSDGRLIVANCAILTVAFDFVDEGVTLAWWNVFEPWTVGNPAFTLKTYRVPGDDVDFQLGTGAFSPAVLVWEDSTSDPPIERTVLVGALRSERSVEPAEGELSGEGVPDIVGSFRVDMEGGKIVSAVITDVDAVATPQSNAMAYAPGADPGLIYIAGGRERLFLSDIGPVRVRTQHVWTRSDTLPFYIDTRRTRLVIESPASTVRQDATQYGLPCNIHAIPSGSYTYRSSTDRFTPLHVVQVAEDEVWMRTLVDDAIHAGVARANTVQGIYRYDSLVSTPYLQLSVYQKELRTGAEVSYPLGLVLSSYDVPSAAAQAAILKGRDGAITWQAIPGYGDGGVHYLNNPYSQARSERQFA